MDSGSINLGSNPSPAAKQKIANSGDFLFYQLSVNLYVPIDKFNEICYNNGIRDDIKEVIEMQSRP